MGREGADALMVLSDPALMDHLLGRVAALAATHRLPAMLGKCMWAGGLLWAEPVGQSSARCHLCGQDPQGAKPVDLPVEQPTQYELVINRRPPKPWACDAPIHLVQAKG
jgi:hypothetical protein